jgi:hypothetical protein
MYERFYKLAKLLAILSVIPVMICLSCFLWSLKTTSDSVTAFANTLPGKVDSLQKDVLGKIDTVQDKLSSDMKFVAKTADDRLGSLEKVTDDRLNSLQASTFEQVSGIRKDLNDQLTTTNKSVTTLTTAYADVPKAVEKNYNDNFAPYFRCQANDLCLQGQASDTMFAIRTTTKDISKTVMGVNKTLPVMEADLTNISGTFAKDIPQITKNFTAITANINSLTHPRLIDRILGYSLNGIIMYRNLNPVTSLTVTGAQLISSKP